MLFVAEYEFGWEALSSVVARRIEWGAVQPDGFRFVGEYVWTDRDPPFRGVAIIEANDTEALNAFALHYGPTLKMAVHAATDVATGIAMLAHDGAPPVSKSGQKGSGAERRQRPQRRSRTLTRR